VIQEPVLKFNNRYEMLKSDLESQEIVNNGVKAFNSIEFLRTGRSEVLEESILF
jgi:hypothetical protein